MDPAVPARLPASVSADEILKDLQPQRKNRIDNYLTGLAVLLLVPLAPLGAELIARHHLEVGELLLAAAIYVVTPGFASQWRFFHILTTFGTFFLSVSYGTISDQNPGTIVHTVSAYAAIVLAAGWTAFERYGRHIVYGRPFFEWEQP